jgi:hypothetical protein
MGLRATVSPMRLGKAIAILIWVLSLLGLVVELYSPPSTMRDLRFVEALPKAVLLFPAVFLTVGSLWGRYPFDWPRLRMWVDRKRGDGTYARFFRDLKPMLLMGVMAIAGAVLCWFQGYGPGAPAYWPCGFNFSCGIGFLLGRVVLARRGLLMESPLSSSTHSDL